MLKPFDDFLMVDWSANNEPKSGEDSIWLASTMTGTINYRTRHKCISDLEKLLIESVEQNKRILCGFDFCFGLPKGSVAIMRKAKKDKSKVYDWEWLWEYLSNNVEDDSYNQSNRFEVADEMNRLLSGKKGPFWGLPKKSKKKLACLSWDKDKKITGGDFKEKRATEENFGASVWQLSGVGAVGSQSLLGIAYLQELRSSPKLKKHIRVYPFENCDDAPIVFAESYYGKMDFEHDKREKAKDEAEVEAAIEFCKKTQANGRLKSLLAPIDSHDITKDEGWTFTALKPKSIIKVPKLSPDEIYEKSFKDISVLTGIVGDGLEDKIRRRMIHACGDTEIAGDIIINAKLDRVLKLLDKPCRIITDSALCASALVKTSLPKQAEVICAIEQVGETIPPNAVIPTRSAVAMEAIHPHLKDSILLIGNAPTALERIMLGITEENWAKPSLIIGIPVGFVGAVESKDALHRWQGTDYITLLGRKGGSAITASALNAILLHKQGSLHG